MSGEYAGQYLGGIAWHAHTKNNRGGRRGAKAPATAKLLLVEAVIDESATGSFPMDMDIEMLVFASGRERTQAQWQAVLSKAGFKLTRAAPLGGGLSGLVEATVA